MKTDSTDLANPLTNDNPSVQSNMFDIIPYKKGSSVIRMIKYAMGEKNFQKSLKEYLQT